MSIRHEQLVRSAVNPGWWRHGAPQLKPTVAPQEAVPPGLTETDSKLPFRMMMAFTFILLLAPQQAFPVLAPLRIALLVIAASVLSYLYIRTVRGEPFLEFKPGIKPALMIAAWAVLTVPMSYWPGGTVAMLMAEFFKTLIVFLLLAHIVDTVGKLRTLAWGLVLMALPLAFTALQNFLAGNFVLQGERVLVGYDAPLTKNPNDLALMLNLLLPFAIALFLSTRKSLHRLVLGFTICVFVTTIIITFSRAGFLALALIFIVYMWRLRHRPERGWIPTAIFLMLLSLPFLPSTYFDRIATITDIEADETGSAQTRWADSAVAIELIVNNPLIGAGAGMNIFAMNEARGETSLEIHNVYLQYGVDLGLPGLLLFLILLGSCLRSAQNVIDRSEVLPDPEGLFYLAEAIKVSLIAFALEAVFHPVAYNFYFYYIAGLAVALRTICDREESKS